MSKLETVNKWGKVVLKGVSHDQKDRLKGRVETSTSGFKAEASDRLEVLAGQIRQLGEKFESLEEAASIARRLEKTADYLRYRPSVDVASDAWEAARRARLLWIVGGMAAGFLIYRLLKKDRG